MAINKVDFGDETLIDLTEDSVTPETLLEGETAHDKSGRLITGLLNIVKSWFDLIDKPFTNVGDDFTTDDDTLSLATNVTDKIKNLDTNGKIDYSNVKNTPSIPDMSKVVTSIGADGMQISWSDSVTDFDWMPVWNKSVTSGKKINAMSKDNLKKRLEIGTSLVLSGILVGVTTIDDVIADNRSIRSVGNYMLIANARRKSDNAFWGMQSIMVQIPQGFMANGVTALPSTAIRVARTAAMASIGTAPLRLTLTSESIRDLDMGGLAKYGWRGWLRFACSTTNVIVKYKIIKLDDTPWFDGFTGGWKTT